MSRSRSRSVLTFLIALAITPLLSAHDDAPPPEITWEPHEVMGADGVLLKGQLGRIRVPENRRSNSDATIEIAFVRFRTTNPDPAPPVFFLAGGPGGSGIVHCVPPATGRRARLLDFCDMIGVDQRGTGLSVPNLSDGPDTSYTLPLDEPLTKRAVLDAERAAIKKVVAHWKGEGVDLPAYNTAESADDIDDVRRALGLDEIILFGSSYGSHLGLACLRQHDEHIARAVLSKVEGPDATWKLPGQIQAQLELVHERVAADPKVSAVMPDFLGTLRDLLERLDAEPVTATVTQEDGSTVEIVCGAYDMQRAVSGFLANRSMVEQLPVFVYLTAQGDASVLGELSLGSREGGWWSAMTLMMDCSSGATKERRRRIAREARDADNLLSDAFDGYYPAFCSACGDPDLGDDFRGPIKTDTPVMFISGTLDARTPPSNVEEIIGGFSAAKHIIVENVGHPGRELLLREYCEMLLAFVRGEQIEATTMALPPLEFAGFD